MNRSQANSGGASASFAAELELSSLTAISPLDGRYRKAISELAQHTSEFALLRFRVTVEIEWFITLSLQPGITQLPPLDAATQSSARAIFEDFSLADAQAVKSVEAVTNHDIKAVEYFVKQRLANVAELAPHIEFVHFGCTSEDINNLAYALMLKSSRDQLLMPAMQTLIASIADLASKFAEVPMLSRTHGQAASPTTMGKELANVTRRLQRQSEQFARVELLGKCNGAVGNYNAHRIAYPDLDWPAIAADFVTGLGLEHNPYTTQIEPHDYIAEYCHGLMRFNQILLDFDRDIWSYISIGYFRQRQIDGETGSSTMPHKVNPIDFENSEGNLQIANSQLAHLASKLPVSRWQRDLSDSTTLRGVGTALGHSLLAWHATLRGMGKLELDPERLRNDLNSSWEVLAEAVQTVMRKYGLDEPYERLKKATRGQRIDATSYADILQQLNLPTAALQELSALTPATYLGYATELARQPLQQR